jgi:hypothetical protein
LQVIMRNGQSPLAFGTWRITFAGTQVAGGSATVSVVTAEDAGGMTINTVNGQPPPALTTQILTDTSGAKRVLAVASYNTNYSWTTSLGGPSDPSPVWGPVGDLSNFSSRGPRRMCSNPAKCPQVMKPEITAPGAMIMSSLAVDQPASATTPAAREADGVHVALNGTSMATPHVTGALALLLQRRPTLTPEDAKQVLFANVQKASFTPALPAYTGADVPAAPDHAWGYGVLDVAKAAVSLAPPSYQGLWWNAQESGWGLNFAHQGDIIFVTWFTYGADNTAQWFASVARKSADNALVYSGTLGTFTGPPYNTVPFPPNANVRTQVGNVTITFAADGRSATFDYTVNGIAQTKQITRQEFSSPVPTCVWGAQPNLSLATNYQDLWWVTNGAESGWGINFTHQGKVIFATWFTYDLNGKGTWLFVVASQTAVPNVYSGLLKQAAGPPFSAQPFDPAAVVRNTVGNATITFTDGNQATFDYTIGGVSQSKSLSRQVFAAPGTVCQ